MPVDCPLVTPELLRELVGRARQCRRRARCPASTRKRCSRRSKSGVARGELSLRGVNPTVLEVDEALVLDVDTPTDLVVAASIAFDDALDERPVLPPDDAALHELAADFWATALWAARRLRKGDVFLGGRRRERGAEAVGRRSSAGTRKAVDPEAPVLDAGRHLERWADAGALSALELAYAHYEFRDAARALWETIDLFQGLEEETARRLSSTALDYADLRRRVEGVVRDPRPGATLWP